MGTRVVFVVAAGHGGRYEARARDDARRRLTGRRVGPCPGGSAASSLGLVPGRRRPRRGLADLDEGQADLGQGVVQRAARLPQPARQALDEGGHGVDGQARLVEVGAAVARGGWRPARTGRRRGWPRRPRPACPAAGGAARRADRPARPVPRARASVELVAPALGRRPDRRPPAPPVGRVPRGAAVPASPAGRTRCSPSGVQRLLTPGSVELRANRESGVTPSGAPPPATG